jgi:hypothetical protein
MFWMPLVSNISGVMVNNICPLTRPPLNTARYALNDLDVTQSQTCSKDQFTTGILLISEDWSEMSEERYCGMARLSLCMMKTEAAYTKGSGELAHAGKALWEQV